MKNKVDSPLIKWLNVSGPYLEPVLRSPFITSRVSLCELFKQNLTSKIFLSSITHSVCQPRFSDSGHVRAHIKQVELASGNSPQSMILEDYKATELLQPKHEGKLIRKGIKMLKLKYVTKCLILSDKTPVVRHALRTKMSKHRNDSNQSVFLRSISVIQGTLSCFSHEFDQ